MKLHHFFIKDKVDKGEVQVGYTSTDKIGSDMLTMAKQENGFRVDKLYLMISVCSAVISPFTRHCLCSVDEVLKKLKMILVISFHVIGNYFNRSLHPWVQSAL